VQRQGERGSARADPGEDGGGGGHPLTRRARHCSRLRPPLLTLLSRSRRPTPSAPHSISSR
jgi:hypothetical protein